MSAPNGSWISDWRKRNKYSQQNLADELGVKRQTIVAWEKTARIDRSVHLALIALEVKPELRLVGGQIAARKVPSGKVVL